MPKGSGCSIIIGVLLGLLLCALAGCKSPCTITEADSIHDTCFVDRWQRDSVFIHDSTFCYIYTQNDTVHDVQRVYKIVNKVHIQHDSIYINKTDTIIKTVMQKEKKKTLKDTLMDIMELVYIFIAAVVVVLAVFWWKGK